MNSHLPPLVCHGIKKQSSVLHGKKDNLVVRNSIFDFVVNHRKGQQPMSNGLLGYGLRKASKMEMLAGGVRLSYLVAQPPQLKYTKSEDVVLVTPREERESLELEYEHIGLRLLPVNIARAARTDAAIIRSKDIYARFLKAKSDGAFHPRSKDLSILPPDDVSTKRSSSRFMPLQMMKPMAGRYSPAVRSTGITGTRQQIFQERLDGKGFGWKKKARSLWQQDVDTKGFRPRRYY